MKDKELISILERDMPTTWEIENKLSEKRNSVLFGFIVIAYLFLLLLLPIFIYMKIRDRYESKNK
jgi:hypothetical protein